MKMNKIFSALMLIGAVAFTACDGNIPEPPKPGTGTDSTQTEKPDVIPDNVDIPENAITVAEANKICAALESGTTSTEKYYVKGWVKKLHAKNEDGIKNFGNASFYMVNNKGDEEDFYAYQVYGLNGEKLTDVNQVAEGDYVVIYGPLTNYQGTYETAGKGAAYIYSSSNENLKGNDNPPVGEIDYLEGEMSVSDFLASEAVKNLPSGETSEETYTVRGVVTSVKDLSLTNGNATFYISDGQNELYCYRLKGVDGAAFVSGKQLEVGDIVTVNAKLQNYFDSKNSVNILEMVNGNLVRTTNTFDPSQVEGPKKITIAEALAIGNALNSGETTPDQYIFSGEVDELKDISTSFGNLTFYIKDEAGNRFYVYRAMYLDNKKYTESDPAIEIGDMIEITGQITNYNGTIETPQGAAYVSKHTK